MGSAKTGPPPEKTITLSSLIAPKLARRDGKDEPFAWESREFLRKKCVGKEVIFKVDYKVDGITREFGSVFLGETNLALNVVTEGWARVRTPSTQGPSSPYIRELQALEETAKTEGVGIWNKDPTAVESAIRDLPPSGVGQESGFDAVEVLEGSKGKSLPAIVEQVRDGSTVRVILLPSFQYVQVYIAGIQCPSAGRRGLGQVESTEKTSTEGTTEGSTSNGNGVDSVKIEGAPPPSIAQRLAAQNATSGDISAEPYGLEAKHFTEVRCLHRDVRVVLEGLDGRGSNLVGSLYYPDGETATDIAPLLVKQGLAKVVEWSSETLEPSYKAQLKTLELEAKKQNLRIWTSFVPPTSNSTAIRDDNFSGKVIEVVSGDCIVVADDAAPAGSPQAERRVNLSSIRAPKLGNFRSEQKPEPFAREAKEFLRTRLIGHQVSVSMEYTRKITAGEGREPGPMEGKSMEFGTVLLQSASKQEASESGSTAQNGINVAEMTVARGYATVVRHRDFEERSLHYDALLAAEARSRKGKKGSHSAKEPPVSHLNDLSTQQATHKARAFLPFLQKARKLPAVVDYVLSGHRFKLIVPREMCAIAFALSGVRCPGKGEPFSEEAIAFMRRRILQHDVEIEVETVDKTGTFIGSLWENKINVGVVLLEAGLAKLHPSFAADRTAEGASLISAEKQAKDARRKVWESYVEAEEGEEVLTSSETGHKRKEEVLEVEVTHVLGAGRFYAVPSSVKLASVESQLKELQLQDKPLAPGAFVPKKGDRVIAFFSGDNSWARALVVTTPPSEDTTSGSAQYEVFYIDYGNQEVVPLSRMRPISPSLAGTDGLALLCQLALLRVPELEGDFGLEAAEWMGQTIVGHKYAARVEERDLSNTKVRGQGTGVCHMVTLVATEAPAGVPPISINAQMLQEGFARLAKRERRDTTEKRAALDCLKEHQEVARKGRINMWQYGDIDDDDEDDRPNRWGPPRR